VTILFAALESRCALIVIISGYPCFSGFPDFDILKITLVNLLINSKTFLLWY